MGCGIVFDGSDVTGNLVAGNYIGTNVAGTAAIANMFDGVRVIGSGLANNTIGGASAGTGNLISGNTGEGIEINGPGTSGNVVAGNLIGTDVTGGAALPNGADGVILDGGASNNWVGANVISGNSNLGIEVDWASDNLICGNDIGTNAAGTAAVPNGAGVLVSKWGADNTIGGTAAADRNLISGNGTVGLSFNSLPGVAAGQNNAGAPTGIGNLVEGNDIGTNAAGTAAIPNAGDGVQFIGGATTNTLGGTAAGAGNVIAFNTGNGVTVGQSPTDASTGNAILSNSIYANAGLGIALGDDGVTPDHSTPTTGIIPGTPNGLQNFPVLTLAGYVPGPSGTATIDGTLQADPNRTYIVQLFANPTADPSGYGQGQVLLSSLNVSTDGSGNASFTATFASAGMEGEAISATATDPNGNTSEFAQDVILPSMAEIYVDGAYAGEPIGTVVAFPGSGTHVVGFDAFGTIQQGLDAVSPAGTVNVAAGTYAGPIGITQDVTLVGAGASQVTINGGGSGSVITVASGVTASLSGLTITEGSAAFYGGGIDNSGTLTVSGCTIANNSAFGDGGGIYDDFQAVLTVVDSTITGNSATYGGGVLTDGNVTVSNSTIEGNTASVTAAASTWIMTRTWSRSPTVPLRTTRPAAAAASSTLAH